MQVPSVVQVHPSWFDWITVAAIIAGPVLALFAQRLLDWFREKRDRRLKLYFTAMSYRSPATWLHPESLRALNSIDTVFDESSDDPVRDAWAQVIAHSTTPEPNPQTNPTEHREWAQRLFDLRVNLYQLMGKAVGHEHTLEYLKTQMYYPKLHFDADAQALQIRRQLAKALTDDGLKVVVSNQPF
jgi:hypothetical protein